MDKKKITMILILVFILVLGGAGILYKQLGQELAPDLLATQAPQESQPAENSTDAAQESNTEKILAPDFTVYDLDGNEVHLSDFIGKPVVLNFWASWCGPCRMVGPIVDEIAAERSDIKVGKINVDEQPELAAQFGVMSIPTLVVMKNGRIVNQAVGARPKPQILAML